MFENVHNVGGGGLKKDCIISSPQMSVSLNADKSAVLATAKGTKTAGGPDPAGTDALGPFLDVLQGVRTTGLPHSFLFFSFFTLSPLLSCKRRRFEGARQRTSQLAHPALYVAVLSLSFSSVVSLSHFPW